MVEKLFLLLKNSIRKKSPPEVVEPRTIAQDPAYLTSVPPFLMFIIQLFKLKNQFTKHFNIFLKDV